MRFGKWSAVLSIFCGLGLLSSYVFASDYPQGMEYIILVILFYGSILLGVLGLIFTVIAYIQKEKGFLKNVALIVVGLIWLVYLVAYILIMIGLSFGGP